LRFTADIARQEDPRMVVMVCIVISAVYNYIHYPCAFWCKDFLLKGSVMMETRMALIGIVVKNKDSAEKLNGILHEYSQYITGRMGLPNAKRDVSIISIVLDGPNDIISALSGKLGMLPYISAKTTYLKMPSDE
jgi:putative iron-only hydrogenase system regulator